MGEKAERRSVETRRGLTLGGPWLAWEVHKGRCMQQPARREGKAGWDGFICPRRFHMFNSEVILHHIACISIIIASGHSTAQLWDYHMYFRWFVTCNRTWDCLSTFRRSTGKTLRTCIDPPGGRSSFACNWYWGAMLQYVRVVFSCSRIPSFIAT